MAVITINRLRGFYEEVVNFPSGYSNDGVFGITAGGKNYIRINKGPVNAQEAGILYDGSDQTAKINAVLAISKVEELIFDSCDATDITISGTIQAGGKRLTFRNKNKIIGTNTINNAIINANYSDQIFTSTTLLTNCITAESKLSAKWWGAANGLNVDQPPLQKAIDSLLKCKSISTLFLPCGNYYLSKGVVFYEDRTGDGQADFISFILEGDGPAFAQLDAGNGGETTIILQDATDFAIGVQRGKGCIIRNLTFTGQNPAGLAITTSAIGDPSTVFVTPGVRDNQFSPHTAINIDPFRDSAFGMSDRYPNWTSYYTQVSTGASTDIRISNVTIRYFAVGLSNSINGYTLNAECMLFENMWIDYNKAAIANGQAQAKQVQVRNFKCWGGTEVVFDCKTYGGGTGASMMVSGCNIAGAVKWLCYGATFGTGALNIFQDVFAEAIYGIGGDLAGLKRCSVTIKDSQIDLVGEIPGFWHRPKTIVNAGVFVLDNTVLANYSAGDPTPFVVDCNSIVLRESGDVWFVNQDLADYKIFNEGRTIIKGRNNYSFIDNALRQLIRPFPGLEFIHNSNFYNFKSQFNGCSVSIVSPAQALTVFSLDTVNRTAVFNVNSGEMFMYAPQSTLLASGTNEMGSTVNYAIGYINSVDLINNRITVTFLSNSVTNTSFTFTPIIIKEKLLASQYFCIGDITSGSNVITNMVGEQSFVPSQNSAVINQYFNNTYFPKGTYITGADSTTLTLSANAVFSGTAAFCGNEDKFQRIGYAGKIQAEGNGQFEHELIWKSGDQIFPGLQDVLDNTGVALYVCTQTGKVGSATPPVFKSLTQAPPP